MFSFLKSMLLPKLQAVRDAFLSGSGSAAIAAVASVLDAVGAAGSAADLRAAAEALSDGDKLAFAKAEMKFQARFLNALFSAEGDHAITVSATAPGAGDGVPHELAACLAHCEPARAGAAMAAAPTAIFTPEQRERFAAFIGAILRGFLAGK